MSKTLFSAALIAGFGIAALAPTAASASDGLITISGKVTGATCTVKVNGSASPTVTLPTVQTSALNAAVNTTAGFTAVKFVLSGCSAGTSPNASSTVVPYFEQGPNTDANGYLTNKGSATGVAVILSKDATLGGKIDLSQPAGTQGTTAATLTSNPTFTYYAGYVSTSTTVGAGDVNTSVQYSLSYN